MSASTRRRLGVGAGLGALYVVVAIVTIQSSGSHVRPLFEGIGPNVPYHWVNPPKAFAAGNVRPHAIDAQVSLGPDGSTASGAATPDAQLTINLPAGAIPPHPPDDHATLRLTPLDPGTLGAAPSGLRANGNVYKVDMTYQPSGQAISALTRPGNVILIVPEPAQGVLFSPEGQSWQKLESQDLGGIGSVGGPFAAAGYYTGATSAFTAPSSGNGGSSIGGIVLVGVLTVALAFGLGFGPSLMRRLQRRRRRGESPAVRAARTQQATARQRKKKRR